MLEFFALIDMNCPFSWPNKIYVIVADPKSPFRSNFMFTVALEAQTWSKRWPERSNKWVKIDKSKFMIGSFALNGEKYPFS